MWTATVIAATLVSCASVASTQVTCSDDGECPQDYFCNTLESICRACLSCQELKREPPPTWLTPKSCIKSVAECGPCLKGLVADRDMSCASPAEEPVTQEHNSTTIWVVGGILIVVLVVGAAVLIYKVSRTTLFKLQPNPEIGTVLPTLSATAPDPPPPYNPSDFGYSDTSDPLIKPYAPPSFEYVNNQNASVFNAPSYVRPPPDSANDVNDNHYPPEVHDETTMPSLWTYAPSNDNSSAEPVVTEPAENTQLPRIGEEGASELSTSLAIARTTDLVQPPPKRLRTQESRDSGDESDDGSPLAAARARLAAPNLSVNVQINLNQ